MADKSSYKISFSTSLEALGADAVIRIIQNALRPPTEASVPPLKDQAIEALTFIGQPSFLMHEKFMNMH